MNKQEFEEYCIEFSSGSENPDIFDRYYNPDAVFEHALKGTFKGKKAIVEFWTVGHKGIREVLKPQNVPLDADKIAAEFLPRWLPPLISEQISPQAAACESVSLGTHCITVTALSHYDSRNLPNTHELRRYVYELWKRAHKRSLSQMWKLRTLRQLARRSGLPRGNGTSGPTYHMPW